MIYSEEMALKVASSLLQIKAIKLQPTNPFTWASGILSPIYCDNRKILSYPDSRKLVADSLTEVIREKYGSADVVAGVVTGGIAHGVLVAERLGLPFVYVRPDAKGHGLKNLIEGELNKEDTVIVVEDLISTGGSSLKVVDAIRDYGCKVLGMTAIFSYGFERAANNFREHDCELFTLSMYHVLIKEALRSGYINENEMKLLKEWRENPDILKAV
jgi:orotate phosphoribosyltransferase